MQENLLVEAQIVHNAKSGDAQAFGQIYDEYYGPIYGFVLNRVKNVEVAKDITSEIFFQAIKNLHRFEIRKGISIKSWLFAIAVAQINTYFRKRSKMFQVAMEECPEIVAPQEVQPNVILQQREDELDKQAQIELLKQYIQSLNMKQQNILSLRYFSQLSITEISQAMKMKEGTVKSHIHRAIKKLQHLMNQEVNEHDYAKQTVNHQHSKAIRVSLN